MKKKTLFSLAIIVTLSVTLCLNISLMNGKYSLDTSLNSIIRMVHADEETPTSNTPCKDVPPDYLNENGVNYARICVKDNQPYCQWDHYDPCSVATTGTCNFD